MGLRFFATSLDIQELFLVLKWFKNQTRNKTKAITDTVLIENIESSGEQNTGSMVREKPIHRGEGHMWTFLC